MSTKTPAMPEQNQFEAIADMKMADFKNRNGYPMDWEYEHDNGGFTKITVHARVPELDGIEVTAKASGALVGPQDLNSLFNEAIAEFHAHVSTAMRQRVMGDLTEEGIRLAVQTNQRVMTLVADCGPADLTTIRPRLLEFAAALSSSVQSVTFAEHPIPDSNIKRVTATVVAGPEVATDEIVYRSEAPREFSNLPFPGDVPVGTVAHHDPALGVVVEAVPEQEASPTERKWTYAQSPPEGAVYVEGVLYVPAAVDRVVYPREIGKDRVLVDGRLYARYRPE